MNEIHIRIVILGDSGSGKSSIVKRFSTGDFSETIFKTVGANYLCQSMELHRNILRLCIWDISGQEKYSHLSKLYSRHCNVIILVCDASLPDQITSLNKWYNKLMQDDVNNNTLYFVCANKIDLCTEPKDFSEIEEFCKQINAKLYLSSAKTNQNIIEIFHSLSNEFINFKASSLRSSIFLSSNKHSLLLNQPKKKCC